MRDPAGDLARREQHALDALQPAAPRHYVQILIGGGLVGYGPQREDSPGWIGFGLRSRVLMRQLARSARHRRPPRTRQGLIADGSVEAPVVNSTHCAVAGSLARVFATPRRVSPRSSNQGR